MAKVPKGVPLQKAQAMGKPAPLGKGAGNTFKMGSTSNGSGGPSSKKLATTMPRDLKCANPKGAK